MMKFYALRKHSNEIRKEIRVEKGSGAPDPNIRTLLDNGLSHKLGHKTCGFAQRPHVYEKVTNV